MAAKGFRRGSVFCPNRRLSSFSPRGRPGWPRSGPGEPGAGPGAATLRGAPGVWDPPGEEDAEAPGPSAGLLAAASRGTATPTGRAGAASGPSRRPGAGGARRGDSGGSRSLRPRLGSPLPASPGPGRAQPLLLETLGGRPGGNRRLARAHTPSSPRTFLPGRRRDWPPPPGAASNPGGRRSPDLFGFLTQASPRSTPVPVPTKDDLFTNWEPRRVHYPPEEGTQRAPGTGSGAAAGARHADLQVGDPAPGARPAAPPPGTGSW